MFYSFLPVLFVILIIILGRWVWGSANAFMKREMVGGFNGYYFVACAPIIGATSGAIAGATAGLTKREYARIRMADDSSGGDLREVQDFR